MRRFVLTLLISSAGAWALGEGELRFDLAGKSYSTAKAKGAVFVKNGKSRIFIGVKDATNKFILTFTADIPNGDEVRPLNLTTEDSSLAVSLRTTQGSLAVLPQVQLAKNTDITYMERVDVISSEMEDDPDDRDYPGTHGHKNGHYKKRQRRKVRSEYRRVKPRWVGKSKAERMRLGEGIIQNKSFRDTYFSLQLTPVLSQGKVVSYTGSFSGTGRFSRSISGAEIKPISNGVLNVGIEYAP
jgi:hypothetical protein